VQAPDALNTMKRRLSLDALFGLASRAADGARVWLAIAAALALAGRRFGRRAAARGLLAVGAVEAAIAAVKPVIRRRRPRKRPAALLARRTTPTSSSLPSAHAAAAFAFAAGAAIEVPVLAAPLGALAAIVSWSRVRTGHHHRSDVLVGAACGVGAAIASRRVWPVAPHEPALARSANAFDEGATPGGSLSIVVNQSAGPALSRDADLEDAFPTAELIVVEEADELPSALARAAAADVIGVCGGDGTVNAAAARAHDAGRQLLVLPGGTLNHFAHALGIESIDDAVHAVENGRAVAIDVGRIDGRPFLNVACFGAYTDLVDTRERLENRIGKWPAVLVALVRVLRRAEPLEVEIDGVHRRIWMAFIGNCRYHPHGFAPSWRERLDDGRVDVRIVDAASPFSRSRLVLSVLTGRLGRSRVYEETATDRLSVRSLQGPLRLAADGEVFDGSGEFTVEKDPAALCVLVPPR
jgi:undecaprenyl-diphosphatase